MDIICVVCNEPWDSYGARHGDMAKWEFELFRKGAGCPSCEGVKPEGLDAEEAAYQAGKHQLFEPDDEFSDEIICAAAGLTSAPKWERPEDEILWSCAGCDCKLMRDIDDQRPYFQDMGKGLYNLPREARWADPEDELRDWARKIEGVEGEFCPCCAVTCDGPEDDCAGNVFTSSTSCTGKVLYGDTYDPGASFPSTQDHGATLCLTCMEAEHEALNEEAC